jgi:hypothetical protein
MLQSKEVGSKLLSPLQIRMSNFAFLSRRLDFGLTKIGKPQVIDRFF